MAAAPASTRASVYRLNGTDIVWRETGADSNFEVERLPNGSVLAGFADGGYNDSCTHTGYRVVNPGPDPEVVGEYGFPVRGIKNSEAHAAVPALPYWFNEGQVLGTLLTLGLCLRSGGQWYRQRRKER